MPYCKGDDAVVCEECGALVAFQWQPEHRVFHEVITALSLDGLKHLKGSGDEGHG